MKNLFLVVLVAATTGCAPTGPVFSIPDRAGLGAFLAFEIVANDSSPAPAPDGGSTPAGDWCDECTPGGVPLYPSHPGKVGDGTIFNTCPVCNGTQKAPGMQQSHAETVRKAGENSPLVEEEMKQFSEAIDNVTDNKETGGNLKAPQPEGGPRRDSYCARSAGQAKKFPAAAKDPNSRLSLARKQWNC